MISMSNDRIPVLVTGVGGGGIGEQVLKALRMSTLSHEIVGCDTTALSKGLMEVDIPYVVPVARDPEYIPSLQAICRKHAIRALIPGSEPELLAISRNRAEFEEIGVLLFMNPPSVIETCLDKFRTIRFCESQGFTFPRTKSIRSAGDLASVRDFPVVLKPSLGGGGSANVFIAQDKTELEVFSRYLLKIYPEYIVQEYVGDPDSEYTVGVLLSLDGEMINSIAVKRNILTGLSIRLKVPNRTKRSDLGGSLVISSGITQGEIGKFPDVTRPCEDIAARLGARGAVNIQGRFVDGKLYVFEINPRFSGTTPLRAMVGYNEPDILIRRHLRGEAITPGFPFRSGYIARGLQETLIDRDRPRIIEYGET